jgi:hypothetical protein
MRAGIKKQPPTIEMAALLRGSCWLVPGALKRLDRLFARELIGSVEEFVLLRAATARLPGGLLDCLVKIFQRNAPVLTDITADLPPSMS